MVYPWEILNLLINSITSLCIFHCNNYIQSIFEFCNPFIANAFYTLKCFPMLFIVIIVLIVSLPSVVTNSVFGLDGSMVDMENPTTLLESYNDLAADISAVVEEGYDAALAKVEQIIEDGGYDYDLSMDALINYAQGSAGYDLSLIHI